MQVLLAALMMKSGEAPADILVTRCPPPSHCLLLRPSELQKAHAPSHASQRGPAQAGCKEESSE